MVGFVKNVNKLILRLEDIIKNVFPRRLVLMKMDA
jgi:hypothetical protein